MGWGNQRPHHPEANAGKRDTRRRGMVLRRPRNRTGVLIPAGRKGVRPGTGVAGTRFRSVMEPQSNFSASAAATDSGKRKNIRPKNEGRSSFGRCGEGLVLNIGAGFYRRDSSQPGRSAIFTRDCAPPSRSRTVTVSASSGPCSPRVSKSMVTQKGVPTSS